MTRLKNLLSLKSRKGDGKERELVLRVSSGGPTSGEAARFIRPLSRGSSTACEPEWGASGSRRPRCGWRFLFVGNWRRIGVRQRERRGWEWVRRVLGGAHIIGVLVRWFRNQPSFLLAPSSVEALSRERTSKAPSAFVPDDLAIASARY
jgi:hypothetical protein